MAHLTQVQETQSQSTCETCSKFQDFNESNGRGWCNLFDRAARKDHLLTQDCQQQLESEQRQELLDHYQAYLKPVINGFPGRDVYKQLPSLGYERIGYVSENLVGWFAHNQHGFPVAEGLPSQNEALGALLESFKPVEQNSYRKPLEKESTQDFQTVEPEEDRIHAEFDDGQTVKVIDEDEDHTEWASFVVITKVINPNRFSSTESYLNEPNWYFLLASVDRPLSAMFWAVENEICHAHQSELIETADIF